jgi:hypothetical protein
LICYINTDNLYVTNCWLHGWTLTNSVTSDSAHGGVIGQFNGGYGITNIIFDHCEISNLENTNRWNGVCVRQAGVLNFCTIHDNSSAILYAQDVDHCTIYDICYPYSGFDSTYHFNGFAMDDGNGNANPAGVNQYCRNSYFYNIGGGANMAYPSVAYYNCYIYNNVFYGVMPSQLAIEVDASDPGVTSGVMNSCYVYNNTIVNYGTNVPGIHVVQRAGLQVSNLLLFNNHIIGVGAILTDANGTYVLNTITQSNLIQSPSQAASQGYTSSNLYTPASAGAGTVGQGTNAPAALFINDILNNQRPSAGWDIGAYQFVSSLAPPSNLQIISTSQ